MKFQEIKKAIILKSVQFAIIEFFQLTDGCCRHRILFNSHLTENINRMQAITV